MTYNQALREIGSGRAEKQAIIGFVCYFRGCVGEAVCALNVSELWKCVVQSLARTQCGLYLGLSHSW